MSYTDILTKINVTQQAEWDRPCKHEYNIKLLHLIGSLYLCVKELEKHLDIVQLADVEVYLVTFVLKLVSTARTILISKIRNAPLMPMYIIAVCAIKNIMTALERCNIDTNKLTHTATFAINIAELCAIVKSIDKEHLIPD